MAEKGTKLLALDLQHFADKEGEPQGEPTPEGTEGGAGSTPTGADNPEQEPTQQSDQQPDNKIPYDRFKQKVDEVNALKEQLDAIEAKQREAEQKKLEEQEEYKTLYEQAQQTIAQQKEEALNNKKDSLLAQAGYGEDQKAMLRKLVEGESDEEITESIEALKQTFPTTKPYADPSPGNSARSMPEKKDKDDLGRSLYARIKGLGK